MILALRTDGPDATLGIFQDDGTPLRNHEWEAHRTLAKELLKIIDDELRLAGGTWDDIKGLICFRGPGSFTGLRIGASVVNTIAHAQRAPVVGTAGIEWAQRGLERLLRGEDDQLILPEYGAGAHITAPKK